MVCIKLKIYCEYLKIYQIGIDARHGLSCELPLKSILINIFTAHLNHKHTHTYRVFVRLGASSQALKVLNIIRTFSLYKSDAL